MFLDMFRSGVRLKPLPAFLKQKGTNQIAALSIVYSSHFTQSLTRE